MSRRLNPGFVLAIVFSVLAWYWLVLHPLFHI